MALKKVCFVALMLVSAVMADDQEYDASVFLVSERFSDIYGREEIKATARKIVDMIKNAASYVKLGAQLPNLITIRGASGTGRKLLAKAIAGEAGAFFVESKIDPQYDLFFKLVQERSVIFFMSDEHALSVVNESISLAESGMPGKHRVFVVRLRPPVSVGSDDDEKKIRNESWREKVINLPSLDKVAREELLKKYARNIHVKEKLFTDGTFEQLAAKTINFDVYQLRDVIKKAAMIAGEDFSWSGNKPCEVDAKHLFLAYQENKADIQDGHTNSTPLSGPFYYTYSEETRFSDVVGLDFVVNEVKEFIDILQNPTKYRRIGVKMPRGLLLEGLPGTGKTLLSRAIAGEAGCCFISVSAAQFINGWVGSGPDAIRSLFKFARQEARNKYTIIFIDEMDSLGKRPERVTSTDNEYANTINELLKQMDGFERSDQILVIGATNNADRLDAAILREGRFDRKVYVPLPDEQGRKKILLYYMKDLVCDPSVSLDAIAQELAKKTRGFTGAGIKTLVNEAAILAIRAKFDVVRRENFLQAFNRIAPHVQSGVGGDNEEGFHYTFSEDVSLAHVVGIDEIVKEVKEFVDTIKTPERYKKIGIDRQKGLLLYGKPGTGKTLLARAIAGETNCCVISASASQFAKLYVGAGPLAVRKLFGFARKMAQNKSVIIFIDEIDALGNRKKSFESGAGAEHRNTLNELLAQMDGFTQDENIWLIGATNKIDLVDDALLRSGRFDKKIEVPLPSSSGRQAILEYYLKKIKLDYGLTPVSIAQKYASETIGYSGASLEGLVKEAALQAVYSGVESVGLKQLEETFVKDQLGLKSSITQTAEEMKVTANHEAGHALIAVLTGYEVPRVSILARTNTLGVSYRKEKHESFSNNNKLDLLHLIMISLGGFCAENLVFKVSTPGAISDLERANSLAYEMINAYGMSEGRLRGMISTYILSDKTKEEFDKAVCAVLQKCVDSVEALLKKYEEVLKKLSALLLSKETLTAEEVYKITGKPTNVANIYLDA